VTDTTHIRFDGWTLVRASGELTRDGRTQRLAPQPLALLLELLDHAGEVVTREALVKILWPRGIVDFDNSLNAVVRKLRVVLGDDSETPRYIETLPRIGYRFIGHVQTAAGVAPIAAQGADEAPGASEPPGAGEAPRAARGGPSIRRPWLGLALFLAAVVGMTMFLRSDRKPAAASAAPPVPASAPVVPRRTTSERAYDLYLQGIFNRSRRDINGTDLAVANFDAALAEDPYYADAWAALAETYAGAAMTQSLPTVAAYDKARGAALRAIELDEKLGHGHAALAHILMMYDHDLARAEAELELARTLDPAYSRTWHALAILRAFQNRLPEAMDAMRRARELEPMTLLYSSNYGLLLYGARRYDEAIAHAKSLLASQPRLDQARSLLIRALVAKGDVAAALEQLPLRMNERPNLADAGFVHARAGDRAQALAEIARIERIGQEGFGVGYDVAIIRAALGDVAEACVALDRATRDHSLTVLWMRVDARMDPLRDQPCFAAAEKKLGTVPVS
jgi:DNA-binding winged helix-turn-helix (wHTH) protein/tetratricopeptide (TPR) repeat protein